MDPILIAVIVAAAVLVVGVVLVVVARVRSRSRRAVLKSRFGDEYDRVIRRFGTRKGEQELRSRLRFRDELEIRDLQGAERDRYARAFESAQATFVQHPASGLRDADLIVQQVMRERGYPVERFEDRAKLVSVDHPELVEHFRSAHRVSVASESDGDPGTEDMRQAMVDHRYLFDALLQGGDVERTRGL